MKVKLLEMRKIMSRYFNPNSKFFVSVLIGIQIAGSFMLPHPAWAVLATANNSNTYNTSNITQSAASCDITCHELVDDRGNLKTPPDDQWCANHGELTDTTKPIPTPAPSASGNCNVPLLAGEDCKHVNNELRRCKFKNWTQLESQCRAYVTAMDAKDKNNTAMYMDAAAATTCAAQCALAGPASAWAVACTAAGMAAGAMEIAAVQEMQGSETAKTISYLAAAGAGAAAVGHGIQAYKAAKAGTDAKNSSSCYMAAGYYAAMAGYRLYNLHQMESSKDKACSAVDSLLSGALANSTTGGGTYSPTPSNVTPSSLNGGGGGGGAAGGGNSATSGTTAGQTAGSQSYGPCPGNAGMTCRVAAASTGGDSQSMDSSNLNPLVAPRAQALENALKDKIGKGTSGGQLMAAAGGGSMGDMGAALGAVADAAQRNPNEVLSLFPNASSIMTSGGGGGGGGGGSGKSDNPFASLFGGGGGMGFGGAKGPGLASFGAAPVSQDIWHTNSSQNLFQIVSDKIGKVTHRLH